MLKQTFDADKLLRHTQDSRLSFRVYVNRGACKIFFLGSFMLFTYVVQQITQLLSSKLNGLFVSHAIGLYPYALPFQKNAHCAPAPRPPP